MTENPANYFKKYRASIGFNNQSEAKEYLAAKDLLPGIDWKYIAELNQRICGIVEKLNAITPTEIKSENLVDFSQNYILKPILKSSNRLGFYQDSIIKAEDRRRSCSAG